MRLIDDKVLIPLLEPADHQAGVDTDSFNAGHAAHWDLVFTFGAITTAPTFVLYKGATAGAKTTAIAFRHRLSSGDFKAASADLYAASDTSDADGSVSVVAATYDHRVWVIMLDSAELDDAYPWITGEFDAAADVLLVSAVAVGSHPRLSPAVTALA